MNENRSNAHVNVPAIQAQIKHELNALESKIGPEATSDLRSHIKAVVSYHSKILTNMAYEMRTSLNAITGFSDLLTGEGMDPEQASYAAEINEASQNLAAMINDVLDLSQLNSDSLELHRAEFSLSKLLDEVETIVAGRARQLNVEFFTRLKGQLPANIFADQGQLRRCLVRLAALAMGCTQGDKVEMVLAHISENSLDKIRFEFHGSAVELDGKSGIALFEPFNKESGNIYRSIGDSGLGPSVALKLAEMLGGEISIGSDNGKAVFMLEIAAGLDVSSQPPLERSEIVSEYKRSIASGKSDSQTQQTGGKILLAEDNRSNQMVARVLLQRMGFEVVTVSDGLEAINAVESEEFDIILLDKRMPNMDGDQAAKQIKAKGITTPIIAVTAATEEEIAQDSSAEHFDALTFKPIDGDKLYETISNFITIPSQKLENENNSENEITINVNQ